MGDKGKSKDHGTSKKTKALKPGNRPHEVRERAGLTKAEPARAGEPRSSTQHA
jgi:hypothetical protein